MTEKLLLNLTDVSQNKFGAEESFGALGPTTNWWIGLMQLGFPEPPEARMSSGLQLAQSGSNPAVAASPQQACAASIMMVTGMWGLASKAFRYFQEEKQRMEIEISDLKIRLARLEIRKETKDECVGEIDEG